MHYETDGCLSKVATLEFFSDEKIKTERLKYSILGLARLIAPYAKFNTIAFGTNPDHRTYKKERVQDFPEAGFQIQTLITKNGIDVMNRSYHKIWNEVQDNLKTIDKIKMSKLKS